MDARDGFRALGVSRRSRAHHVVELAAERLDGGADLVEDVDGLAFGIAGHTMVLSPWVAVVPLTRIGGPPARPRVAGDRLPAAAGVDRRAPGPREARGRVEDARKARQVVTQIAGGREERRLSVFVAAIAGNLAQLRLRLGEPRRVRLVEREAEHRQVVAAMLALAEPRADDHGADGLCSAPSVATLATETPCLSAIVLAAARTRCRAAQPPTVSTNRLYFDLLQSGMVVGSG